VIQEEHFYKTYNKVMKHFSISIALAGRFTSKLYSDEGLKCVHIIARDCTNVVDSLVIGREV
jgi:hypothetical protein